MSARLALAVPRLRRLDPLGALLAVAGATAVIFLPFVVFKPNRIVPGDPRGLLEVLPAWGAFACQATLLLAAIAALSISNARVRLGAALLGVEAWDFRLETLQKRENRFRLLGVMALIV